MYAIRSYYVINVLMIEDDSELAEILIECLNQYNIHITNYETPELGISGLAIKKYDLVILDLSLPDIDGIEVCRIIREKYSIPIIISSARSNRNNFVQHTLYEVIRETLGNEPKIGQNTTIMPNAYLGKDSTIGDNS